MNKVIRIISLVLLGVEIAAFFLWNTKLFGDATIGEYAYTRVEVRYILPGLLLLSGILCLKSFGFKNRRILRIVIGALGIGIAVAALFIPEMKMNKGGVVIDWKVGIIGIAYVVIFFMLLAMHIVEIFTRKGLSKIFSPIVDLLLMVFVFAKFAVDTVPAVTQIPQYQYFEYVFQYGHYAIGGALSLVFLFAFIELFTRKKSA